jgi:HEAT repeat protein
MPKNSVNNKLLSNHSLSHVNPIVQEEEELINLDKSLETLARGNFDEKWVMSKVLVKYGDIVISPLQEVILNEQANLEHRCFALKILSQLKNPQIILVVTQLLMTTQEEELIALATQTLAVQGKESIAFLSELLADENYRLLACKALAQIPSSKVIEPLLSVVEDKNIEVKKVAISALNNFNNPKIIPIMVNALQDYNSDIRKEALIGLGLKLKTNQEIPLIKTIAPLLNDINLSVAQQAAMALSRCRHPSAVSTLEKVLVSSMTPQPLKETTIKVLGWIATNESIKCLGKCINLTESSLAVEIIKVLGRVNQPELKLEIITILDQFYQSKSAYLTQPDILQALCYSWTQLQAIEALSLLQEIQTSDNETVAFHAQSAIKTLCNLNQ